MSLMHSRFGRALCSLMLAGVFAMTPAAVRAQEPASAPEPVAFAAGIDFSNQYAFRGVRQNTTGVVAWPYGELVLRVLADKGVLDRLIVGAGFWNSLNTGDTGFGGPAARAWYESRLSGTLGIRFDGGLSVTGAYTTYISPNELFTTAREVGVTVAMDDGGWLGRAAIRPYALAAFEVGTTPGVGQLDGGLRGGRYLELGATPGWAAARASIAVPIKVGLSLQDYYELGGRDHTFGFASAGAYVSVPIGRTATLGRWHVRGGAEIQRLGTTTRVFNGGDRVQATASVGLALTSGVNRQ